MNVFAEGRQITGNLFIELVEPPIRVPNLRAKKNVPHLVQRLLRRLDSLLRGIFLCLRGVLLIGLIVLFVTFAARFVRHFGTPLQVNGLSWRFIELFLRLVKRNLRQSSQPISSKRNWVR